MIIPWVIASVLYFIILVQLDEVSLESKEIVLFFASPYNHLWFVPALFAWVIILWVLLRFSLSAEKILVLALAFTAFWVLLISSDRLFDMVSIGSMDEILRFKAFGNLLIFFFFGFYLGVQFRNEGSKCSRNKRLILIFTVFSIVLFVMRVLYFYRVNEPFLTLDYYLLDLLLISIVLLMVKDFGAEQLECVKWIGKNSLAVYLYHVVIILFSLEFFYQEIPLERWYLVTFVMFLLLLPLIHVTSKVRAVNRYLFGIY